MNVISIASKSKNIFETVNTKILKLFNFPSNNFGICNN